MFAPVERHALQVRAVLLLFDGPFPGARPFPVFSYRSVSTPPPFLAPLFLCSVVCAMSSINTPFDLRGIEKALFAPATYDIACNKNPALKFLL